MKNNRIIIGKDVSKTHTMVTIRRQLEPSSEATKITKPLCSPCNGIAKHQKSSFDNAIASDHSQTSEIVNQPLLETNSIRSVVELSTSKKILPTMIQACCTPSQSMLSWFKLSNGYQPLKNTPRILGSSEENLSRPH